MTAGLLMSHVAFFGRTLAEYLEMFAISLDELREGTTLDCPSGPASFVAEDRPRYVAASLPTLPFADQSVDRVLAGNFLFS